MLYTPLLPEAASGTLEPRHVVVPLRQMCPHAELVLGRATALDLGGADRQRRDDRRAGRDRLRAARRRARRGQPRSFPVPGLAEHGRGFKDLADAIALRNHVLQRLEAAAAGGPRVGARLRLRRRGLRGGRGARGAQRPRARGAALLPVPARRAAALGARRCGSDDPGRDPAPARRRTPRRSSSGAASRSTSARRSPRTTARRPSSRAARRVPARTLVWTAGVKASPLLARVRPAARRARARARRRDAPGRGARRRLVARRLRRRAEHAHARADRSADLPARAAPGAPAREEPQRRAAAVRLPHARPGRDARPLQGHRRRDGRPRSRASSAGSSRARTTSTRCRS